MGEIDSIIADGKKNISADGIFYAHDVPVMDDAYHASEMLRMHEKITIYGIDQLIPNAVSIANILNEKIRKGNCKINDVLVDSAIDKKYGKMLSVIVIKMTALNK